MPGEPTSNPNEQDREQQVEGGPGPATMPEVDFIREKDGKRYGSALGDAESGSGNQLHRGNNNDSGNQNDGRAWGREDEEGEMMGLLTTLSEGGHRGGVETLTGAGDIGDAIGRGRRQEERMFLEVCLDGFFLCALTVATRNNVSSPDPSLCPDLFRQGWETSAGTPFQRLRTDLQAEQR